MPPGSELLLHTNGFGGTPQMELYLLHHSADTQLRALGFKPVRVLVGNFTTSLERAGASLTVTVLDEELKALKLYYYSFRNEGWAVALNADRRVEDSRLHYTLLARMSQLDLLNYHGLGNTTAQSPGVPIGERAERNTFYSVNQTQWVLHPAVALPKLPPGTEVHLLVGRNGVARGRVLGSAPH